ncbi:hypothetical protein ACQRIU_004064 [Beauveria bassiana]
MTERIVGPFGRDTQHPHTLFPNARSTAQHFTVWSGQGSGDAQGFIVIKGMRLSSFEFQDGESGVWSIRAGWRIVRFEINTDRGRSWAFGGTSGDLFSNVANGKLIGFELSTGWEVDWAKITFLE